MKPSHFLARSFWLASALISGTAFAGGACNKQPVSPRNVEAIGRDMIVNGVPTSMVGVQFDGTPDDVTKQFREFWADADVPTKRQTGPSGLLLSALDESCLYVLTIPPQADGEHTRALMSVIRLSEDRAPHRIPDSVVPLPQNSRTISDVESRDPDQTGRTRLLEIPGDARENALQYQAALSAQGWSSIGRTPDYQISGSQQARGTSFAMQHGHDSVDASFSNRGGKTIAVVNVTRSR